MPLACASGLYLQGERGSRREKELRKLKLRKLSGTSPSRTDNSPFFELGTVELVSEGYGVMSRTALAAVTHDSKKPGLSPNG